MTAPSTEQRPSPPLPEQKQTPPGRTNAMQPRPDHGEDSYQGSGKLIGKKAIITGADSGIGRAVAIAYAREGADVLISYLDEHDDARDTARLVEEAGRKALLVPGDITSSAHCRSIVEQAVEAYILEAQLGVRHFELRLPVGAQCQCGVAAADAAAPGVMQGGCGCIQIAA